MTKEEKLVEIIRATLTKLGWKHKMEGSSTTNVMFMVGPRVYCFIPKAQDTGKAEVQTVLLLAEGAVKNAEDFQARTRQWTALSIASDPANEWHQASLSFGAAMGTGGPIRVAIRYILGDVEEATVMVKDSENLKGVVDFLADYRDHAEAVNKELE